LHFHDVATETDQSTSDFNARTLNETEIQMTSTDENTLIIFVGIW